MVGNNFGGVNDNWGTGSSSSSNWSDWDDNGAHGNGGDGKELVVELVGNSEYCKERFRLKEGANTIGRSKDSDIIIDFSGVSRHHATIEVGADGTVTIMDNQSGNGTSLGGSRIDPLKRYPLQDGDTILISKPSFILSIRRVASAEAPGFSKPVDNSVTTNKRLSAATMVSKSLQVPVDDGDVDIEFDDEVPPAPAAAASSDAGYAELEAKLAKAEAERQQLARLFELAVRYLTRDAGESTSSILFKVLNEMVDFDCAFAAVHTPEGKMRFSVHPKGAALVKQNKNFVAQFAREGDNKHTVVLDGAADTIAMAGLNAASRAIIPFGNGGRLVLISQKPAAYANQVEYLDLIGRLHTCIE